MSCRTLYLLVRGCARNWVEISSPPIPFHSETRHNTDLVSGYIHTIANSFSWRMNSNGPEQHQSFAHIKNRGGAVGREGLCTKTQSSLLNIYFHLSGFQASLLLIYFATGRILQIKSTRYVKFHIRKWRGAASVRHRNHAALTVHLCEQKRCPM